MSVTKLGGIHTRDMNYAKYGRDFYERIGSTGGKGDNGHTHDKGFGKSHEWAVQCGIKGGTISKRGKSLWHLDKEPFDKGLEHARV